MLSDVQNASRHRLNSGSRRQRHLLEMAALLLFPAVVGIALPTAASSSERDAQFLTSSRSDELMGSDSNTTWQLDQARRNLDALPCKAAGTCGHSFNLLADDARIDYRGFVQLSRDKERAHGERPLLGDERSIMRLTNPGATVSFSTDAHRVQVIVEYRGGQPCRPDCPVLHTGGCYNPKPCPNQCEVVVEVDGQRQSAALSGVGAQDQSALQGEVKLMVMEQEEAVRHAYSLHMPWGAVVDLKRVHLETVAGATKRPTVFDGKLLPQSAARYVAYGDSITTGWCAPIGYPHMLGELNGWEAVNLGVVGAGVVPEHADAIGRLGADIITIMVGASEWVMCVRLRPAACLPRRPFNGSYAAAVPSQSCGWPPRYVSKLHAA
eukprot:3147261-Pleurochrysis_carterae.AAC.2